MNATQSSPLIPGAGPKIYQLSPLAAADFQMVADKIGIKAARVAQEALRENIGGLIGVQLGEKQFAYYEPAAYKRVLDAQVIDTLESKASILEKALSEINEPKDWAARQLEIQQLEKVDEVTNRLRIHPNTQIQQLVTRIDTLREQLASGLKSKVEKTEFTKLEAAKVQASATQVVAQKTNWFVRLINAIVHFFTVEAPLFFVKRFHGDRHLARSYLTAEKVAAVVQGSIATEATIKATLARQEALIDSGNPAFNEELRKECNRKCERLFERLAERDHFVRQTDDVTAIDDKDIKEEIAATINSLKRLKTSTKNCIKNASTPEERQRLEEALVKTRGALFQVSTCLAETNKALRIDKAFSTHEIIQVASVVDATSTNEVEGQLRGLRHLLIPLEAERALVQDTIEALEKEVTLLGPAEKTTPYQTTLKLLRNQLKEIRSEIHGILTPIKQSLKDTLRIQNLSERPDVRHSMRQLIAKQETMREIDAIPDKKKIEIELTLKMNRSEEPTEYTRLSQERDRLYREFGFADKLAAKMKKPKDLERNPRFAENLTRAAKTLLNQEKKGAGQETVVATGSNGVTRAAARAQALEPFEKVRSAVGTLRRQFFDEVERWHKDPKAFVLTARKLMGEDRPYQAVFVERSEVGSGKGVLNTKELDVDQYIAFRKASQPSLVHAPSLQQDDEMQILMERHKDLACFMFVREQLRNKKLSPENRSFLEKDFLELEQRLMSPPYAYMEFAVERDLTRMNNLLEQYALDYVIDASKTNKLTPEILDLRQHIRARMGILERTYRKELEDSIPPAPDETHPIDDKLQLLINARTTLEDFFDGDDFKDTRIYEFVAEFANESRLEQFPSYERALKLHEVVRSISKQPFLFTMARERVNAPVPLIERMRQAKDHLDRMMPDVEEERDAAFIRDFIKSNGRDQYYNMRTGEYATTRQEGKDWITYGHDPHAINHMIQLIHKYKEYGFHDIGVTQEILNSDVIVKRIPLQREVREALSNAVALREFATQYNESLASGRPLWHHPHANMFVCSATRPEGAGWEILEPWQASAKVFDYFLKPLNSSNPLSNELWHNSYLLSQKYDEYARLNPDEMLPFVQQKIRDFETTTPDFVAGITDRLNELVILTAYLQGLEANKEIDKKQFDEYLSKLKGIKDRIMETHGKKEAELASEFHSFSNSPHALGIFENLDGTSEVLMKRRGKSIEPTYLPKSAGKAANYPAPKLSAMKGILSDPYSVPVNYKVHIDPELLKSGEVHRAKLFAALQYINALLTAYEEPSLFKTKTAEKLSEEDVAFLIRKRAMLKNALMYVETPQQFAKERMTATVIAMPKPTHPISGSATIATRGGPPIPATLEEDLEKAMALEMKAAEELKIRQFIAGIPKREEQFEKYMQQFESKDPKQLSEYVQRLRFELINKMKDGAQAYRDHANHITNKTEEMNTFIGLMEKAQRLDNFIAAVGPARQPEKFLSYFTTFLTDPSSFTEIETAAARVSEEQRPLLLGEKPIREVRIKQLLQEMTEDFEEIKRLNMTEKSDIRKYSEFKIRLTGYQKTYEDNFRANEVDPEVASELQRLLAAIPHAMEEKAELYRRKQGLPVDTGRMKVVTYAEMRARARRAAEAGAEAAISDEVHQKLHPPSPQNLMKEIVPLLRLVYKNQAKIESKLKLLSTALKDRSLKLTPEEIKFFRESFQAAMKKAEDTEREGELRTIKHLFGNVDLKLRMFEIQLLHQHILLPPKTVSEETTKTEVTKPTTIPEEEPTKTAVEPPKAAPKQQKLTEPLVKQEIPKEEMTKRKEPIDLSPPPPKVAIQAQRDVKEFAAEKETSTIPEGRPLQRSPFVKPRDSFVFVSDNWKQTEISSFAKAYERSIYFQDKLWMRPRNIEAEFRTSPSRPSSAWENISEIQAAMRFMNFINTEPPQVGTQLLAVLKTVRDKDQRYATTQPKELEARVEDKLKEISSIVTSSTISREQLEQSMKDILALTAVLKAHEAVGDINSKLSSFLVMRLTNQANELYEASKRI